MQTNRAATISTCGLYRPLLTRTWHGGLPKLMFIMLNPSTADGMKDDATIRRCIAFARAWGFGGIVIVNLFAFRATKPKNMKLAADPVGPGNDDVILGYAATCAEIVCAWGANGSFMDRDRQVMELLKGYRLQALKITKGGQPGHPLYIKGDAKRVPYHGRETKNVQ